MESISEGVSSGCSTFLAYRAAAEATGRVCLIRSNTSTANYRQVQKYTLIVMYTGNLNLKFMGAIFIHEQVGVYSSVL